MATCALNKNDRTRPCHCIPSVRQRCGCVFFACDKYSCLDKNRLCKDIWEDSNNNSYYSCITIEAQYLLYFSHSKADFWNYPTCFFVFEVWPSEIADGNLWKRKALKLPAITLCFKYVWLRTSLPLAAEFEPHIFFLKIGRLCWKLEKLCFELKTASFKVAGAIWSECLLAALFHMLPCTSNMEMILA